MATEAELRRRMSQLEREIGEINRSRDRMIREMERDTRTRMADLETRYQREMRRQAQETQEAYTRRLRQFQEQMLAENRRQISSLQREFEAIQREQDRKIKELDDCTRELQEQFERLRNKEEETDAIHRSAAEQLLQEAEESRERVRPGPHEFFFPGEFELIDDHVRQIRDEIRQRMFQAAAADASGASLEFDLLRARVDQSFQEWMGAFERYRTVVLGAESMLEMLRRTPLTTPAGRFTLPEAELDFWASGACAPLARTIREAAKTVHQMEEMGVQTYLKSGPQEGRRQIFRSVTEALRWTDQLVAVSRCIVSERTLSDERWAAARAAKKVLKNNGYAILRSRFRPPDPALLEKTWYPRKATKENPLDSWELEAALPGLDVLHITLVPVRQNGVAVRNECLVSLEPRTIFSSEVVQGAIRGNVNRLQGVLPRGIQVLGVQNRDAAEGAENQRKRVPSPSEQIRLMERKYPL